MRLVDWVQLTGWLVFYAVIFIGLPLQIYLTRDRTKPREWHWFRW